MPSREELDRTIRAIFAEVLQVDPARIRPDTDLREELWIGSLQLIDLAFEVESALGVELENKAVLRMRKFSDVLDEIEAALAQVVKREPR